MLAARGWLEQVAVIAKRGRQILGRPAEAWGAREIGRACERLVRQRGEASSIALASEIVQHLRRADRRETKRFLEMVAVNFAPDLDAVRRAAAEWSAAPTPERLAALAQVVEPPRQELFRRLNMIPGGTQALVELRAALLRSLSEHPEFAAMDADLKHLFASWFNRG